MRTNYTIPRSLKVKGVGLVKEGETWVSYCLESGKSLLSNKSQKTLITLLNHYEDVIKEVIRDGRKKEGHII